TVQNMRDSDAQTIASGVTSAELMYRAALGLFQAVRFVGKIAIVCGSGNNGGDGYALACVLLENGITPTIFRVNEKFSKVGLFYYQTAMSKGAEEGDLCVPAPFTGYDIVVDCLLGTGFSGEVRGEMRTAIELINACSAYIISADINSGVNGDTGEAAIAVNSDLTVSIGSFKVGMFLGDAPYYIGSMRNADIGIQLVRQEYHLIDWEQLHVFEGYNSVVMTEEEFRDRFDRGDGDFDSADRAAKLSAELGKIIVVKTGHSAMVADMQFLYFCADYII
ncbi:MAG: NAD(P)H-hydrate epimerase, partial [Ruminococcus sp.]|nr:NAD(P)H-hydrate epimerase [Ruminococcus sp.]